MDRNPTYKFVNTNTDEVLALVIKMFELITGQAITPASPDRLLAQWVANIIVMEREHNNYTGNQNLPSRAEGDNLDALAELFYTNVRPAAQAAKCTERFYISAVQATSILIPLGTRVTDASGTLAWETTVDAYIPAGNLCVDVMVQCQTVGTVGNGYAVGQINTIKDIFNYFDLCTNVTQSDGGADAASDNEFYELMRNSQDAYSCAGAMGGYVYFAKSVSKEIADVVANSPTAGHVHVFVLMSSGTIAGAEIKSAVMVACNDAFVRPLTDYVVISDADLVPYDIDFTYIIPRNSSLSATEIRTAVEAAVAQYKSWQSGKLGRDINPSHLLGLLMQTGVKRIVLRSPTFTALRSGSDNTIPQIASLGKVIIVDGGYEDE